MPRTLLTAAFAAVVVAGILPRQSGAQDLDPSRKITQYRLRTWSDESGLPQNSVLSVIQLRDGTVLAGTEDGLALFDGNTFGAPVWGSLAKVGPVRVTKLVEAPSGTIWIATRGAGLIMVAKGGVTAFGEAEGLPGQAVESIHIDAAGFVWIGTSDAGLFRLEGGRPVAIPLPDTPGSDYVQAISSDDRGRMLIGTRGGLFIGRPGSWRRYGLADGLRSEHVYALTPAPRDTVWIGTAGGGLAVLTGGVVRPVPNVAGLGDAVLAIRRGGNGVVWLGTNGGGLHRLHAGKLQSLTTANGLPSNLVWSLASDDEDGLWIGTNGGGVTRLDDPPVSAFGSPEGLSSDIALATLESRDGTLWVGTAGGGLNAIERGVARSFTTRDGLATNIVTALHEDPSGALWVGTSASGLHLLRDGRIERIDMSSAFPGAGVNSIRVDAQGRVWVGSNGAGLAIREGSRWRYLRAPETLPSNFIYAMATGPGGRMYVATGAGLVAFDGVRAIPQPTFADPMKNDLLAVHASPSGSIWLGSQAHGISRLREGRMVHIGADLGLHSKAVNGILEDSRGTMWITTNGGILAVPRSELEAVADGKRTRISGYSIGKAEGMRSRETNGGIDPPGWVGRDGRVWIPTMGGVVTVDGSRLATMPRPRVSVTGFILLDSLISVQPALRLPGSTQRLAVAFRALSFSPPGSIVVQYRLTGVDPGWVDAGDLRLAEYTSLPVGEHTFEVRARHQLGDWSLPASLTFGRAPRWWERSAVQGLALLLLAVAALAAHRVRLRYWKGEASRHRRSAAAKEVVLAAVRERETRFSALLEHASDAIFLLDASGAISYVSPSMEHLTSRTSEELLGKPLLDLVHPDDRPSLIAALDAMAERPRTPTPFRYRVELSGTGWHTFAAIGRNLLDEPVVGGIIVNARDITEQEEAESLFRQAQKMDAIGKLAGGIAHDFNNLLAVIGANVSLLREDLAGKSLNVEGLDEISHATAGGQRLTSQLLSFSKRQAVNPAIVDLDAVAQETVPMLRPLVGSAVKIAVDRSSEPAAVFMDRGEVEQVIVNLVVNAAGAMPGGGTVTLSVSRETAANVAGDASRAGAERAVLAVHDTGVGMDAETLKHIFDPFFTTKSAGTGLGLATVARIAKKAGGFIKVDSTVGKGSTFAVHLPIAEAAPSRRPASAALPLAGVTVLVVDDDEGVRKLIGKVLRGAGANVLVADSGKAALAILAAHEGRIHILLTDLVMPGMPGRELAERIAELRPMPVVFMSGYTDDEIARSHAVGGDVGFLPKPFTGAALLAAVEGAIRGSGALVPAG